MRRCEPLSLSLLLVLGLTLVALTGCITGPDASNDPSELTRLSVYEYRYGGDDVAIAGVDHGWMARITNTHDRPVVFVVAPLAADRTQWAPATQEGWDPLAEPQPDRLAPGESRLYLFRDRVANDTETGFEVRVVDLDWDAEKDQAVDGQTNGPVLQRQTYKRTLRLQADLPGVAAGDHVRSATVGVWLNGTSFYTNIADLNASIDFPAGYDRSTFGGDPLPVYVYEDEASEQPARSRDDCYFVTIAGYNTLLKTQAESSTNVRWLAPQEAYTRPGAEEHWLYGDTLIFLNTIVRHDGTTDETWAAPDPQGDCFHPNRYAPVPLPVDDWPPV